MAGEYTGGAYMGVNPIGEDFGDIALQGMELDMQQNAMKIAARKQRASEAKAAQDRVVNNFKDFDELAAKALNIHARNFDQEVVGQMVSDVKGQIAEYARRLQDPITDQAEIASIKTRMRTLADNATNFVTGQQRFQEFIDSLKKVDGADGWDSILSGSPILEVNKAILSAAEKGMTANGDGTYSVGEYMRYRLDEEGTPVLMTRNKSGEWVTGTIDETVNRWRMEMVPYVDLHKGLWDYAGKDVESRAREYYRNAPGGLIEVIRQNNWGEIDRMIGEDFDVRFPDADSFDKLPKEVRKAIASGDGAKWNSRDDVRNEYIRTGRNRIKDETGIQLRDNKDYLSTWQQWKMNQEEGGGVTGDFLEQAQGASAGMKEFKENFVGKRMDLNVPGMKGGDVKLEDMWRQGNKVMLEVRGGYQGQQQPEREVYEFDVTKPESVRTLLNKLAVSYNEGKGEKQKVSAATLRDFYEESIPMFKVSDDEKAENEATERMLSGIDQALAGKKKLSTGALEPVLRDVSQKLKEAGYDVDINGSWFGLIGDMNVDIYDQNGDGVVSIDEVSGDELARELRKAVYERVINPAQAERNPGWIKGGGRRDKISASGSRGIKVTAESLFN